MNYKKEYVINELWRKEDYNIDAMILTTFSPFGERTLKYIDNELAAGRNGSNDRVLSRVFLIGCDPVYRSQLANKTNNNEGVRLLAKRIFCPDCGMTCDDCINNSKNDRKPQKYYHPNVWCIRFFKCAWLPSAKSKKLEYPFNDIGDDPSKLLIFTKQNMTCRCIAAYLSSKCKCSERRKVEQAKEAVKGGSYEVLCKHCKTAVEQYDKTISDKAESIAAVFAQKLKEYFLREPVFHVLANAGVGDEITFEKYADAGDLASAVEEYYFLYRSQKQP